MTDFSFAQALAGDYQHDDSQQWFTRVTQHYACDETTLVEALLNASATPSLIETQVTQTATSLIEQVRQNTDFAHAVDKLLQEYSLNNEEGVILMCLAEALMRIPDAHTADKLIADKLSPAKWEAHLGNSSSLLVNASTWGLLLTGKVTRLRETQGSVSKLLSRLINSAGEPVIRAAMNQAMKVMGKQFVLGRSIDEAIKNGQPYRAKNYTYSFDMLGEAALTDADALRYFKDYKLAIERIGASLAQWPDPNLMPSISVKLSALFSRYEATHEDLVLTELFQRMVELCEFAQAQNIALSIDAEEMDRLEISLQLFAKLIRHPSLAGWGGLGLVVQAYSKRALPVLGFVSALAYEQQVVIPVRLVKGAYWDSEIKWAQIKGQANYPVFTRKENTDLSYLVCAQFLMQQQSLGRIYPQFATHNAHTVAYIQSLAEHYNVTQYEFQRLHGMGDALYDLVVAKNHKVRIYAPVGAHKDLLPYLVRRLLENGANSSFVHRLVDAKTPVATLVESPWQTVSQHATHEHPRLQKPRDLFLPSRRNSAGENIMVASEREPLLAALAPFASHLWEAIPTFATERVVSVHSPYHTKQPVGKVYWCSEQGAKDALQTTHKAFSDWHKTPVAERAHYLNTVADLLEEQRAEFISLCQREAGKTLQDAIDEVREAVDFLRYYAVEAVTQFAHPTLLPGPTGERNEHYFTGRGVFVCISPWNFPLAIFIGQLSAALVAGNTVIAKPAEATSLIAHRAVALFYQAGLPQNVLAYVPGSGAQLGRVLLSDTRVSGVAFTGSTQTAQRINRQLAQRDGAIATFIAETGGNNAMIVDSSALPEQVVKDAFHSAFASAGQRCSALRILCVQEDIAERIIELMTGAMTRWQLGDPTLLATDAGPVIDETAHQKLTSYIAQWQSKGAVLAQGLLPMAAEQGYFVPPTLIEIAQLSDLGPEQFGPVLHVLRYKAKQLDQLIQAINDMGYGLTLGIHSRNEKTAAYIESNVRVGNCYINRNQIGAVVGVQPFGGCGLSGTGPKAGGPNYLQRFATERTRTINTTAVGGNATLLADITMPDEL